MSDYDDDLDEAQADGDDEPPNSPVGVIGTDPDVWNRLIDDMVLRSAQPGMPPIGSGAGAGYDPWNDLVGHYTHPPMKIDDLVLRYDDLRKHPITLTPLSASGDNAGPGVGPSSMFDPGQPRTIPASFWTDPQFDPNGGGGSSSEMVSGAVQLAPSPILDTPPTLAPPPTFDPGPLDATTPTFWTDPVWKGADPTRDPRPWDSIDPQIQREIGAARDLIHQQPAYDRQEYMSAIYRTADGSVGHSDLLIGDGKHVPGIPSVPKGATIVGYVHNHPLQTAIMQGIQAGYDLTHSDSYIHGWAGQPSVSDMGTLPDWARRGAKVDPSAMVYVDGPDGELRGFDPRFHGHPDG